MSTPEKVINRYIVELVRESDPVKAAWNACHALADEAREKWGDYAAATVFSVSASIIRDWMAEEVTA